MNSRQLLICVCSIVIGVSLFKPAAGQNSIALSYGMGAMDGNESYNINGFSFTFRNEISKRVSFGLRASRFSTGTNTESIVQSSGTYTWTINADVSNVVGMVHGSLNYQFLNSGSFHLFGGIGIGGTFSSISVVGGNKKGKGFFSVSPGLDFEVLPFRQKTFGFCGSAYYCKGLTNDFADFSKRSFATDFYAVTAGAMVKF